MSDMLVHNVYRDGQWVAEIERHEKPRRERLRNLPLASAQRANDAPHTSPGRRPSD
jgi:hypothetical protein